MNTALRIIRDRNEIDAMLRQADLLEKRAQRLRSEAAEIARRVKLARQQSDKYASKQSL